MPPFFHKAMFEDRRDAGRALAQMLGRYTGRSDVIVLGLPRGGVPVGYEVAQALDAPLDVFVVRKLGVPGHEELAMGAIATGGVIVLNQEVVQELAIPDEIIEVVVKRESKELARREELYRDGRPAPDLEGRIVILVDDGLATGSTMRAAAEAVKAQSPVATVVAVPVAAGQTCQEFEREVDEIVCAETPDPFYAVGLWYRDFAPTTDDEVRALIRQADHSPPAGSEHSVAGSQ